MKTSAPPTIAPAVQLFVTSLVIIIVSVVAINRHVRVFTKLLDLFACPVPGMCAMSRGIDY